jgi:hypothetical protein
MLALPALAVAWAVYGDRRARTAVPAACLGVAGFAAVWLAIEAVKRYLVGGSLTGQVASLGNQVCFDPRSLPGRIVSVLTDALPVLYGGTRMNLQDLRLDTPAVAGSPMVGWLVAAAVILMVSRIVWSIRASPPRNTAGGFGVYLACIGLFTVCVYPLSCNIVPGGAPLLRYLLLALLLPTGCFVAFMHHERRRSLRAAVTAVFVVWGAANTVDNVRVIRATADRPPLDERRALVTYLLDHHVRYARAIYWDAYVLDFLSRERVIVSSVDVIRVPEYQRLVDAHASAAVTLVRLPCRGGDQVASWCVQGP